MTQLVVVTPVYEDAVASAQLFRELATVFGEHVYVVAVDDGTRRAPVDPADIAAANVSGVVIRLRRNVGHQRAIAVGLNYAVETIDAHTIVVMDSDGEDVPQTIVELVHALKSDEIDVVVAERRNRVATLRFRMSYQFYKWLFRLLSGRKMSFGNFMAMKPAAARQLVLMPELCTHLAASVLASKLRVEVCPIDRGPRYAGESKMRFVALALHGVRSLRVFAEEVLLRIGIASAIGAATSIVAGIAAVLLKLNGLDTPGWLFIALGVAFIVSLQIGAIALIALMLTSVVRSASVVGTDYRQFVHDIHHVEREG